MVKTTFDKNGTTEHSRLSVHTFTLERHNLNSSVYRSALHPKEYAAMDIYHNSEVPLTDHPLVRTVIIASGLNTGIQTYVV